MYWIKRGNLRNAWSHTKRALYNLMKVFRP